MRKTRVRVRGVAPGAGRDRARARGHRDRLRSRPPFKAAWIYVGPHNDGGWSQAHDQGRLYVQKALGCKVQTTFKENVPEGPQVAPGDREPRPRRQQDHLRDVVRLPGRAWRREAKKHPDVEFEQATGTLQSKNMAEYFGAGEDAIYLAGMAAGAATKKGVIGSSLPFPIPEVIRHANAFTLGAQATHPGAKVKLVWTNSWFDPAKEKKAAESLSPPAPTCSARTSTARRPGQYAQSKQRAVGRLRLGRAEVRADVVADRRRLQLGRRTTCSRVKAAMDGTWKTGLLLRQPQGRLRRARAVRSEREREDEGADRRQAEGARRRHVLRVHRSAQRPDRQAPGAEGQEADGHRTSTR